jgi:hypothetical protein
MSQWWWDLSFIKPCRLQKVSIDQYISLDEVISYNISLNFHILTMNQILK